MELDDLKYYLKNKEPLAHSEVKTTETLAALLKHNPKSPINKLKRSLVIEIIITLIMIPSFVWIGYKSDAWSISVYFYVLAFLSLLFIVKWFQAYNRIQYLTNTVLPVKKNLEEVYYNMNQFVRRYFQLTMASIPIFFTFSLLLGFYEGYSGISVPAYEKIIAKFDSLSGLLWFAIGYIVFFSVVMFYGTKWYLTRKFQ
ncbi:MAG: hypothetical protein ACOVNY_01715 [Chitinophagaceae bacterium]